MQRTKVEIFSAGCPACDDAADLVTRVGAGSCEVEILDMHDPRVAARAKKLGVRTVPAVAVDGRLASCCQEGGVTEAGLRATGLGAARP
jgi:glutaredoxin